MRTCDTDDDILNYVRVLSKTRSKQLRAALVGGASTRVVKTLCNFCSNALYNTAIKPHVEKCHSLRRHKEIIRRLATRRVGVREKRRILADKSSSFLYDLVSNVSSALGAKVNDVVSR
jgi:hypothetical protein